MNFDAFSNPDIVRQLSLGNRVTIERISMIETGTYNPLFARNYTLNSSNGNVDSVSDSLSQRIYDSGVSVTPDLVSGLANGLISQSTEAGDQLSIPYGWDQRRFRFRAEVRIDLVNGMSVLYEIQGFSEYLDVSLQSKRVDPNMKMFINSITKIQRSTNAFGQSTMFSQGSSQILNGAIVQTPNSTGVFGMRPRDVVSEIQWNYMDGTSTKLDNGRANITGRATGSSRENAVPSMFLSKTLSNWMQSLLSSGSVGDDRSNFTNTLTKVLENEYDENHFIKAIIQKQGPGNGGWFTMNTLSTLDPSFTIEAALMDNRLNIQFLGAETNHDIVQIGSGSQWNGRDLEAVWAASLSQSVPAIMTRYFIGKLAFTITNMNALGTAQIQVTTLRSPSLAAMNPMTENMVSSEIQNLIFNDLSMNNLIPYEIACEFDLYGDTKIIISFDSRPMQVFFMPTFCDSLATPVIAHDKNALSFMALGLEQVMRKVGDNVLGDSESELPVISMDI